MSDMRLLYLEGSDSPRRALRDTQALFVQSEKMASLGSLVRGQIRVESREGAGSTFTITLPMNLDRVLDPS